jgi:hypothetical protein
MNCRDVREVADSFLCEELLTETNHEILRHLDTCPSCRADIEARRRLRSALQGAFNRAPDLQPRVEFADRLREQLRDAAVREQRPSIFARRWLGLAAGIALAAGVGAGMWLFQSAASAEALARDAIGDHRNCALKFRLVRAPVPLEEAAQQFDSAYRLLLNAPPDDVSTPGGLVHVIDRHSCAYGTRRFGHVVMEYRGRIVSLLMTASDGPTGAVESADAIPHVIGRPMDGLSVVSVTGSQHAILLVSDLPSSELTQLSRMVSLPLAQRAGGLIPDGGTPAALFFTQPVQESASALFVPTCLGSLSCPGGPN